MVNFIFCAFYHNKTRVPKGHPHSPGPVPTGLIAGSPILPLPTLPLPDHLFISPRKMSTETLLAGGSSDQPGNQSLSQRFMIPTLDVLLLAPARDLPFRRKISRS